MISFLRFDVPDWRRAYTSWVIHTDKPFSDIDKKGLLYEEN